MARFFLPLIEGAHLAMAIVDPQITITSKQINTTDGSESTEATVNIYISGSLTPVLRITAFGIEYNQNGTWKTLIPPTIAGVPIVAD